MDLFLPKKIQEAFPQYKEELERVYEVIDMHHANQIHKDGDRFVIDHLVGASLEVGSIAKFYKVNLKTSMIISMMLHHIDTAIIPLNQNEINKDFGYEVGTLTGLLMKKNLVDLCDFGQIPKILAIANFSDEMKNIHFVGKEAANNFKDNAEKVIIPFLKKRNDPIVSFLTM